MYWEVHMNMRCTPSGPVWQVSLLLALFAFILIVGVIHTQVNMAVGDFVRHLYILYGLAAIVVYGVAYMVCHGGIKYNLKVFLEDVKLLFGMDMEDGPVR